MALNSLLPVKVKLFNEKMEQVPKITFQKPNFLNASALSVEKKTKKISTKLLKFLTLPYRLRFWNVFDVIYLVFFMYV